MSDGVANPSKEIERPGLRDRQTEAYLSNKQGEQNFAKGVSHLSWRILTCFGQSFNDRRVKLNPRGLFLLLTERVKQAACHWAECETLQLTINR
jgi:hypothetical protein